MNYIKRVFGRLDGFTIFGLSIGSVIGGSLPTYIESGVLILPTVFNIMWGFLVGLVIYDLICAHQERK